MQDELRNEYFEWLFNLVCGTRFSRQISYKKLLMRLHDIPFVYSIPKDRNRAEDGVSLRYRFALVNNYDDSVDVILDILDGPCSVLEMMIALAIKCEENIMDDPNMGDRTTQWFWEMIVNLGLGAITDARYDRRYVDTVIAALLDRDYEPDGTGGLFVIKNCDRDLRKMEIWHQLCWYLDSIT